MLQYDVHPFIGNTFGPIIFMICVLGGLGNMIGGFIAAFIISQIIAIGGYYSSTELAYVLAFVLFIVLMILSGRSGILARNERRGCIMPDRPRRRSLALPFFLPDYFQHLLMQILLWGLIYTAWSLMGRFGFVSLGHGAFMGIGAYVPGLAVELLRASRRGSASRSRMLLSRWRLALVVGYPCFRLQGGRPLFRAGDPGAGPGGAAGRSWRRATSPAARSA